MPTRCPFISLTAIALSSALLVACVQSPDDVARLSGDHALSQQSEHGLVEATVSLESAQIARGPNDFSITLQAAKGSALPVLISASAAMAAHGHYVRASSIDRVGETFRALDLDLFMSGRWQVALGVELEESSDLVEFALDVP